MKVEIVDDTDRNTIGRADNSLAGRDPVMMMARDRQGRRLQDKAHTVHVFEGRYLDLAILRARRWIRNAHKRRLGGIRNAPKHIALKLAAFHKVDPDGFKAAMQESVK